MSRPRYYWYGSVKKIIMQYPELKNDGSIQGRAYVSAIEKTLDDTKKLNNGDARIKAIDDILFKKIRTIDGVALEQSYHWRTVQDWITKFVKDVGKNIGF